jgi:single-stranded-DNA-specific exonuclease
MPLLTRHKIVAEDLGFSIGPLLNSDGRLADAFGSVNFLLSEDISEATPWAQSLHKQNQERKSIQKAITSEAMQEASSQVKAGKLSLVINLSEGHAGVHGISASRIKDAFGRPCIIFSSKTGEPDIITGSARSIDNLHMKDVLQTVSNNNPGLINKFGGHKGAAGISINRKDFSKFEKEFENTVEKEISKKDVGPIIYTDGALDEKYFSLDFVDQLLEIDPYGREFEKPYFETIANIKIIRFFGQDKTHAQVVLNIEQKEIELRCIWFNVRENENTQIEISENDNAKIIFALDDNFFRGKRSLQLQILYAEKI